MILHRRGPRLWVFAVDHDAVQLSWRALHPGRLRLEVHAGAAPLVEPTTLHLAVPREPGDPTPRADAGAVTLTGLPAGRLLTVRASGSALDGAVEVVARTLPALGGEELTRIATISDLHLGTESFGQRGTIREREQHDDPHPWRCATAAIDAAVDHGARHLVAKGDLTNLGLAHQWRAYARLVATCPVPLDAVAGNHDRGAYGGGAAVAPTDAAAAYGLSIANPLIVRDLPGVRLVLADTTIAGRNRGTVHPVAADVLDAAAEAPATGGVLVVLHHQLQPHALSEGPPVGIPQQESARFLDQLGAAHPHVLLTSGHTHRHRRWARAGVVVTQVGATKDYPGVWASYRVHEGGISQSVRRIERPDCIGWTDRTRRAGLGAWEHVAPGRLDARCFDVPWSVAVADRDPAAYGSTSW
ncbi:MAG: metallophosphoesterase family protein [Acidimicrobiales bacterium]|nr:metallophosphoesterase family protein [Acidimicrobiales bacterium]HRW37039.1 metallophosphoesterase family protein [Aquihabitans sp.]